MLSCDNVELNGQVCAAAVAAFADRVDPALGAWIRSEVAFPSSMVDRITPATTAADRALVRERWGLVDQAPVVAEPFRQWVVQDHFPAGRPAFQDVGAQVVDDVRPYELMKLRLLNAGHQALAYAGALRGHRWVHEAVADPLVAGLLRAYLDEAVPTLDPVPGVDLAAYCDTLLERFGNPAVADTVARLCAFTSDRIPTFLLPVAHVRLASGLPVDAVATVVATWAHYRRGVDEQGAPLEVVDRRAGLGVGATLLSAADLFADLPTSPPFRTVFDAVLRTLEQDGTSQALRA